MVSTMVFFTWFEEYYPWKVFAAAVVTGVTSHIGYFIRGEHHVSSPMIARVYLILICLISIYGVKALGTPNGTRIASLFVGTYLFSLLSSILIYRLIFHRLRGFPGPYMAGASKIWHVFHVLDSHNHIFLDNLYTEYGQFVRTGPTELTIFSPEVLKVVDGPGNNCTKAVWYDILLPLTALNTTRDKAHHDRRRRVWNQGFTKKALKDYEDRVNSYGLQLEAHIATTAGTPVNVSTWFYFLTFDVMGDFAFARSFQMLKNEKWHYAVLMLRRALTLLGPLSPVPWLIQLAFSIPIIPIVQDWNTMIQWCSDRMSERIEIEVDKPDISSCLINESKKNDTVDQDRLLLDGDSVALIVAGSDTVASTLIYLFYRLALDPTHVERLRVESHGVDIFDPRALQCLDHLNGVINEILRLHPSVPTGGYRETPPEGITIAGRFIPGGVTVVAPRYTIGRLPSSFVQPNDFVPERWYSKPEMIIDRRAFNPFSIGRYTCVGKDLAIAELRFVTTLLISRHDVAFAPGENGERCWKDMRDQFTAAPGKLELVFTPRQP